jgi:hypothetical protein
MGDVEIPSLEKLFVLHHVSSHLVLIPIVVDVFGAFILQVYTAYNYEALAVKV